MGEHVGKVTASMREIPIDKQSTVIGRTVIGLLFVGLGIWLLYVMIAIMRATQNAAPNLWMFGGGLASIVIGATTWSTKIVSAPFKFAVALLRDVADIVLRRTSPDRGADT